MDISSKWTSEQRTVLVKALFKASTQLHLNETQLATILGIDPIALSKLKADPNLDHSSRLDEASVLLISLVKSLYSLTGGDADWIQHFMNTPNQLTGGIPVHQIETIEGLKLVLNSIKLI
jgi:hypothetical protein